MSASIEMLDHSLAAQLQIRLCAFVRTLRHHGFKVGVAEELDAQQIASFTQFTDHKRLRWGLRNLLCSCKEDWRRFDELFEAFWIPGNLLARLQMFPRASVQGQKLPQSAGSGTNSAVVEADRASQRETEADDSNGTREGASYGERLVGMDFQFISDRNQQRQVELLVERLARRMRRKVVRRQQLHHKGRKLDLRRTLRSSLHFGGMPLQLQYRCPQKRQPRLVVIVDVSRSMSLYSTVFLRFARGLVNVFRDADAFACHTHLVHISDALRQPDALKVKHHLTLISQGWSGGTRLGDCLERFNKDYSRRVNRRSLVVIVSDGLDTGEPQHLCDQLEKIKLRCRRLLWLNPLIGRQGYEVQTQSMSAALPLLDLFAPAHNLQSLMDLEPHLVSL